MWYDDPFVKFKKRKRNRRRRPSREPILLVNARMLEQRQERMRRVGTVLLCLVAVVGAGWLMAQGGKWVSRALFSQNDFYSIRTFDLRSDGHRIPDALIKEFAQVSEGMNLFAVSLPDIRSRLEGVPLVKSAEVQRMLPDGLRISIVERVAIANLGTDRVQNPKAIDRHGVVLYYGARAPNLPTLTGVDPQAYREGSVVNDARVQDALHLLDVCDTDAVYSRIVRIRQVDVSDERTLEVTLDGNRKARLARKAMLDRLQDMAAFAQHAEARGLTWTNGNFTVANNPSVR